LTIQPAVLEDLVGLWPQIGDPERPYVPARGRLLFEPRRLFGGAVCGACESCLKDNDLADAVIDDYYNILFGECGHLESFGSIHHPRDGEEIKWISMI
jgi:hypothetical protein